MRIARIVVGIDLADGAAEVLRRVAHDLLPGAEVVPVHALGLASLPPDEAAELRRLAEVRLRAVAEVAGVSRCTPRALPGATAAVLARAARECAADVVAIGAPGGGARVRWAGGTLEELVHHAAAPVLVVRAEPAGPPPRLVVGVDGTVAAEGALLWSRVLARHAAAEVTAVHVIPPTTYARLRRARLVDAPGGDPEARVRGERRAWVRGELRRARMGRWAREARVAAGIPARELVGAARRCGAGLLVVGSHGPGLLERLVWGSTAATVAREADCSVLVVPRGCDPRRTPSPPTRGAESTAAAGSGVRG